jgi:hypothetical protein
MLGEHCKRLQCLRENNVTVPMYIILNVPELHDFFRKNLEIVTTNYEQWAVHVTHVVDTRHAKT